MAERLTPLQRKALQQGLTWRLRESGKGGNRIPGLRELNNEDCFSSRTLKGLLAKGLMRLDAGGYVTTDAGRIALAPSRPSLRKQVPLSLGRWREPNPHLMPGATIEWLPPAPTGLQTWVGVVNGRRVATIKRQPAHARSSCTASLDGFLWDTSSGGAMWGKENVARGFASVSAAQQAIAEAIRLHP